MGARENKVENYLNDEVEKLGGLTRKWVSPGHSGVPDRIVFYNNHVIFVEVKTHDGKTTSVQSREHHRLAAQGASIMTVHGQKEVDSFIDFLSDL